MNAMNVLLTVEYDGTAYVGWQRQPAYQGVSVQQRVEEALSHVLGHPVSVTGAGRTDAGVHALGQRCNFRCDKPVPIAKLAEIVSNRLPPDIRVTEAAVVPDGFHARYVAKSKRYRYILERQARPSAFGGRWSWQIADQPDLELMRRGAELLVGEHDFRHFTVSGNESKTSVRRIYRLDIT
ncbi:MAG: tRNA pseudouridine synthase A, partial [Firmicutes bacterium]|nr:tRNA pseudouridine synthase A [Bacillota bacterium]